MIEEKMLTKHPQGKNGKNISKQRYDLFKDTILSILKNKEFTHTELFNQLNFQVILVGAERPSNSIWKHEN
jgi:hypothetical protein